MEQGHHRNSHSSSETAIASPIPSSILLNTSQFSIVMVWQLVFFGANACLILHACLGGTDLSAKVRLNNPGGSDYSHKET